MCRSSTEPGGPRRCASDTRTSYRQAAAAVALLEHTQATAEAHTRYGCPTTEFTMPLPPGVEPALLIARRAGTPFIVGGAVRDAALGVDPKDIDIEVHGTNIDALARCYRLNGFQVDEVGRQFGVLKISKRGVVDDLDVSVPRRDSKIAAGHRGFAVDLDTGMTVTEAAARRDFTINALLYDPRHHLLLDPFGGAADLKTRTLRHVSEQFREDPLRVLRGAQMAGRFGMTLHPDTAALCRQLRPNFNELAVERTREEWAKLFTKSTRPDLALRALQDSGWDDTVPGLRSALSDPRTHHAFTRLSGVPEKDRVTVGAAVLSATMSPSDREQFLHHTVTGTANARIAADLAATPAQAADTGYDRNRYAHHMFKRGFTFDRYLTYAQTLGDPTAIQSARAAVSEGIGAGPQPALIQGRDVLAAVGGSRKPGPWVGELVDRALDHQHRGDFHSREAALRWITQEIPRRT